MIEYYSTEGCIACHDSWHEGDWVNVVVPTEDESESIRNRFHVPESFLEDIADINELPRMEKDGKWTLIIIRVPKKSENGSVPYKTVPVGMVFTSNILITICHFRTEMISDFVSHVARKNLSIGSVADFSLHFFTHTTTWYLDYLTQLSMEVEQAKIELERSIKNKDLLRMMSIQQSLVYFNTALQGNNILLQNIKSLLGTPNEIDEDLYFDSKTEVEQAINTVNVYSHILETYMSTFESIISNNVNDIMKKMTSVSLSLMVPTLVASFYGMNVNTEFANIGGMPLAFWFIVAASFLFAFLAIMWFRRHRWF